MDEGTRIGPYRIRREVGRGGQALVYLAVDERLGRPVALKVFGHALDAEGNTLRRFRRESEITARLDHPGICTVFEAGEHERVPYIAMRFVEGETLAHRIAAAGTGPRDERGVARTAALFERVARALHVAHEAGLVHRDIKPANIMVTPGGDPVLMDFGLALEESGRSSLTATGAIMGTPAYVAPEVVDGKIGAVDRRTDVYSLGVSLHEALAGRPPFEAPTRSELYHRILSSEAEDARRLNPAVPSDLAVVVATAMAKEPDRRYQTALDLAEDLRRVLSHEPIRARPAGPLLRLHRWSRRNPGLAASLAALVVALAGGLGVSLDLLATSRGALALAREEGAARDRALRESREAQRETAAALADRERALERAVALDLVGASALAEREDPMLALLLARLAVRRHPSPETFVRLRAAVAASPERGRLEGDGAPWVRAGFSPDGARVLARGAGGALRAWDLEGNAAETADGDDVPERPPGAHEAGGTAVVTEAAGGAILHSRGATIPLREHSRRVRCVAVSPDGARVLTGSDDGTVRLWDREGRELLVLVGHDAPMRWVAFSPGGDRAVTTATTGRPRLWDLERREVAVFRAGTRYVGRLAFSPDGRTLRAIEEGGTRWAFPLDGRPSTAMHEKDRVVAIAPTADRLLVATAAGALALVGPAPGSRVPLDDPTAAEPRAAWAESGERIVVIGGDGAARVRDVAGALLATLRDPTGPIRQARLSPLGDLAATVSDARDLRAWRVADGAPVRLGGDEFNSDVLQFSRAGDLLVTGGRDDTTFRIWDLSAAEPACAWIQYRLLSIPAIAAAGDIVSATVEGGVARIWDRHGGEVAEFRSPGDDRTGPRFSPDGLLLATAGSGSTGVLRDRHGREEAVLHGHPAPVREVEFSSDGRLLATASDGGEIRVWVATREGLLALAESRITRGLDAEERERHADLLPEDEALELVARRVIEEALRHEAVLADCPARLRADETLDPALRERALLRLSQMREHPGRLNDLAWLGIVREGNRPERYARALRQAQVANELKPGVASFINTLGVALYRSGRHEEALDALTRSDALHSAEPEGARVGDVSMLALACRRLGREEEAQRHLARLRPLALALRPPLHYFDEWFLLEVDREFGTRVERAASR